MTLQIVSYTYANMFINIRLFNIAFQNSDYTI